MINEEIPKQLKNLIIQYGIPTSDMTPRFKSLLQDVFVDNPREMNLFIAGLEEGLPVQLNEKKGIVPHEIIFGQMVDRLSRTRGIDHNAAEWVVRIWAEAIGYDIPAQKKQIITEKKMR